MSWALFSILAALIWAIVSTVDKYILTKWTRNPIVPITALGPISLIAAFLVYLFKGFSFLSYINITLALVSGIFYTLMAVFYFKAVKTEEISRIAPLFYLTSLFILILAAVFLGEIFSLIKYLGVFLLVIGAVLISSKGFTKVRLGKAFWFMILSSLAIAINAVIIKYLLNFADFWTIFSYSKIGVAFASIPIFYLSLPGLVSTTKKHGKKVIGTIFLNESLDLLGDLLIIKAYTIGYVTLVNALSSVHPFFVLIFVIILTIFYPQVLKEEIEKSIILIKLIAIILMFIGAILII